MGLGYVFRQAISGLGRNITMTIALVITTAISLALLTTGLLVTNMTEKTKDIYLGRVEVMVQLDEDISGSDDDCSTASCKEVKDKLEDAPGVTSVEYYSRERTYERFVEVFQDTDPKLVEETSPEALPAALHVRLEDPLDVSPLEGIADMDQVVDVVDQADDLRAATDNLDSIRNATFLFAAVQTIAAIFLIANMVQIAAFNRRREIEIMRMVGASRWYTQAPFVIEAVIAAIIGAVLSAAGLFIGKTWVVDSTLHNLYQAQLIAPITNADIWTIAPLVGIVGVVFAGLVAQATLRFYVRK